MRGTQGYVPSRLSESTSGPHDAVLTLPPLRNLGDNRDGFPFHPGWPTWSKVKSPPDRAAEALERNNQNMSFYDPSSHQ
jgi:hypothetical protein